MSDIGTALAEIVSRKDIDTDKLEKFLDLQFRFEDKQNEKAFHSAMSKFQKEVPIIKKTGKVSFKATKYSHGELDEIIATIKPHLSKNGLSFSFNTKRHECDTELITIIAHVDGHSKEYSYFFNTLDDGGSSMNSSQKRRSALTYAKRTALENSLGLVCADEDDDARRCIDEPISSEMLIEIEKMIEETGSNLDQLLKYMRVDSLDRLSVFEGSKCIKSLKQKRIILQAKGVQK